MPYPFKQIFAVDESAPERVAQNGVVTIFEPGDPAQTPLTITSLEGMPLPNPIQVNAEGYGPAFMHATMPQVAWAGAGFSGTFESYEGMRDEAIAARQAAQEAAAAAQAPTKEAIDQGIARADIPKTVAAAVAADPTVVTAAAAAVDANPKIAQLETVTIPKAFADAKTYAQAEVTKDRVRLTQAEAADIKQNADIRETLRAALAYADAKAADISRALDTSHVALDTDGTPYYRPGSITVRVQQDTDGTPFYEAA